MRPRVLRDERWLLPPGVDELLPPHARRLEMMRRGLLDLFHTWGYELVMPPFLEYLESLLSGPGAPLDIQTFKVIDQESGRLMGIRADMTPQVARIDALHQDSLKGDTAERPVRLCYLGTVLHARPEPFFGSRTPLQLGAELYGHAGVASDVEVMALMVAVLEEVGIPDVHLDIGHFGVYRALVAALGLDAAVSDRVFDALQRKAPDEIALALATQPDEVRAVEWMTELAALNGDRDVLGHARSAFANASPALDQALDELVRLSDVFSARCPDVPLHFDLGELRGYSYHGGPVFAAFVPGVGTEVARGGRYDQTDELFGRPRPATGFSADLRLLTALAATTQSSTDRGAIFAPVSEASGLAEAVKQLRRSGERVVEELPGQAGTAYQLNCDRRLLKDENGWAVVPLELNE